MQDIFRSLWWVPAVHVTNNTLFLKRAIINQRQKALSTEHNAKKYGRRHLPSIIIGPLRLHEGKRLIVINFLCSIPIIRDYTERHTSEKERKALMMNGFLVTLLTLSKEHVCKTSKQFTTSVGDDDEIRAEDDNLIGLFVSQLTRPPPTTNIT